MKARYVDRVNTEIENEIHFRVLSRMDTVEAEGIIRTSLLLGNAYHTVRAVLDRSIPIQTIPPINFGEIVSVQMESVKDSNTFLIKKINVVEMVQLQFADLFCKEWVQEEKEDALNVLLAACESIRTESMDFPDFARHLNSYNVTSDRGVYEQSTRFGNISP